MQKHVPSRPCLPADFSPSALGVPAQQCAQLPGPACPSHLHCLPTFCCCPCPAENSQRFTARNTANVVWALAKMDHHPGAEFLQALADHAVARGAGDFNPQNIANTLWAYATLGEQQLHGLLQGLPEQLRALGA